MLVLILSVRIGRYIMSTPGEGTSTQETDSCKIDRLMQCIERMAEHQAGMQIQMDDMLTRQVHLETAPTLPQEPNPPLVQPVIDIQVPAPRPVRQQAAGVLLRDFSRVNPPTYIGSTDPNVSEEWLLDIESMLETMECDTFQRVLLATFMLRGEAKKWWRSVKDVQTGQIDWAKF